MIRVICRSLLVAIFVPMAVQIAAAQEMWSGSWSQDGGAQGGHLEFLLTDGGMIDGNISNGTMTGLWNGFIRDDGVMFAEYQYPYQLPGFAARAVGRVFRVQGNRMSGGLVFVANNQVIGQGRFELTRKFVPPQQVNPRGNEYPFTGNGMYVYCAAPSICGQRGGNTLPGNWGWTSGLFNDIKTNYPQVYCNLYPGSCAP